jgi:hypothetical protein
MPPSERRLFVQNHRTCVFGYGRKSDGPAMSIVYYVPDDNDDLLVATIGPDGESVFLTELEPWIQGEVVQLNADAAAN